MEVTLHGRKRSSVHIHGDLPGSGFRRERIRCEGNRSVLLCQHTRANLVVPEAVLICTVARYTPIWVPFLYLRFIGVGFGGAFRYQVDGRLDYVDDKSKRSFKLHRGPLSRPA